MGLRQTVWKSCCRGCVIAMEMARLMMISPSSASISRMEDRLTLRVKNAFAEIPAANEAASRWLAERNAPPSADYLANLAIEELVTNCIKYGYDDSAEHIIEIEVALSAGELVLTVSDDGHPF